LTIIYTFVMNSAPPVFMTGWIPSSRSPARVLPYLLLENPRPGAESDPPGQRTAGPTEPLFRSSRHAPRPRFTPIGFALVFPDRNHSVPAPCGPPPPNNPTTSNDRSRVEAAVLQGKVPTTGTEARRTDPTSAGKPGRSAMAALGRPWAEPNKTSGKAVCERNPEVFASGFSAFRARVWPTTGS
jgi:hypothetical protein